MDDFLRFKQELKEQSRIEKQGNRRCGDWIFIPDGVRGVGMKSFPYKCGHCQSCYEDKAKLYLKDLAIAKTMSGGIIKTAVVTDSKAKELMDAFHKHNVKRFPIENGMSVVYISASIVQGKFLQLDLAKEVRGYKSLKVLPSIEVMAEIVGAKDNREDNVRVSGALGRVAETEIVAPNSETYDGEETEDPRQYQFFMEAFTFKTKSGDLVESGLVESAWNLAIADTADMNPQNINEKQKCYNKRKNRFLYYLLQWGYLVAHRETHSRLLTKEELGWDVEGAQKIKALYSNFLREPHKFLTHLRKTVLSPA